MPKTPIASTIDKWQRGIHENGLVRIRLRSLLRAFGAQRRGSDTLDRIKDFLLGIVSERGEPQPIHLDLGMAELSLDDSVYLRGEPVRRLGPLFEGKETEFERRFGAEILKRLGLEMVGREYSPLGTRDRLDLLAHDTKTGEFVVVELKLESGQRRAVEQVLRYIEHIKRDRRTDAVRGVLITGVADSDTERPMRTLQGTEMISWYLYKVEDDTVMLKLADKVR